MFDDMLKKSNIKVIDEVENWQDAIQMSVQLLVNTGYVKPQYANAIIDETKQLGPYYILAPAIALPHARPEMGVIKKQLAVLLIKKGILFPKNNVPVQLLIVLAATDSVSHLTVLQSLSELIMDKEYVEKILHSNTADELYSYLI